MSEWISIKDKVPPVGKEVLVYRSRGLIEIQHRINEEYPDNIDIYNRYVWSDQGIANDITHWMPIPPFDAIAENCACSEDMSKK